MIIDLYIVHKCYTIRMSMFKNDFVRNHRSPRSALEMQEKKQKETGNRKKGISCVGL